MRWWLFAIVAACGGRDPPPPLLAPAELEIFVDDASVATVSNQRLAAWPRLDALVPEPARRVAAWRIVYVTSVRARTAELDHPASSYPELVPAVFPGDGGEPAFGMFTPAALADHGKPKLRMDAVREIRIKLSEPGRKDPDAADPPHLALAITTPRGDGSLDGAQILAIPREPMPGEADPTGWPLTKLLAAAGVTTFAKLVLVNAAGTTLALARAEFDDTTTIPFVKLNRRGELRFRIMKNQGGRWQTAGDLRAVATIRVD